MAQLKQETLQDRLDKAMVPPSVTALIEEARLTFRAIEEIVVKDMDPGLTRDRLLTLVTEGVREE